MSARSDRRYVNLSYDNREKYDRFYPDSFFMFVASILLLMALMFRHDNGY